jgi:type IV pilus assembly protein PilM
MISNPLKEKTDSNTPFISGINNESPKNDQDAPKKRIFSPQKLRRKTQPYLRQADEIFFKNNGGLFGYAKSSQIIVIEFGSTELKLMLLSKYNQKYQVEHWEEIPIQPTDLDKPDIMLESAGHFLSLYRRKKTKIVLVLNGPQVISKTIKLPHMAKEQLKEAVFWKVKQEITAFSDRDQWDYKIIQETKEGNKKWLWILTIIAKGQLVKQYLDILAKIDIHPSKVIVKPVAFALALKNLTYKRIFEKKNIALIEMGRDSSQLCFFRNGVLQFFKILAVGYDNLDKALSKPLVLKDKQIILKPEKMEYFKRKYGIVSSVLREPDKVAFPFKKLFQYMLPSLQKYVSEIKRSLIFYENYFSGEKIQVAFITGKGAKLKNLNSYLVQQLGFPVFSIGPFFSGTKSSGHFQNLDFTSCFGAACHEGKNFNLIPKILRTAKKFKYWQKMMAGVSLVIFFGLTVYSINLWDNIDSHRAEKSKREMEFQKILPAEKKFQQLTKQYAELDKYHRKLLTELQSKSDIVDHLKIFSALIPEDIVLTSINFKETGTSEIYKTGANDEGKIVLSGMVYKNFMSADITLIQFIARLQDLHYYKNIEVTDSSKDEENKMLSFKIIINLP